jgi:cytosolic carboxypeptidase protein 2/3
MEEISAPLPLIQKKYSLEPDMIFGWRPKTFHTNPIPLNFRLNPLPSCKDCPEDKFPIIYHGYRPQNSYTMHRFFSGTSTYNYIYKSPAIPETEQDQKSANKNVINGMKLEYCDEIEFDSYFECGNLDKVLKIDKNEYDLYMRSDTNTYGNYKWFYFKVINKTENRNVKINIVNFKEQHSLFTQGQKPMVKINNSEWEPLSYPISYKLSKLNKNVRKGVYYQLSFEVYLKTGDVWYIATTVPYSLSELYHFLDSLPYNISVGSLGKSLSGISIPIITITNSSIPEINKQYIIIQARQHPSETVSSFIIQSFIQFLITDDKHSKLLDNYIFKVIPLVNVDGVVIGNSRMSFAGDDLNRKFAEPDKTLHPEVIAIKKLAMDCNAETGVFMFIDIHGHSKKKGSFMYGPYFPLHSNTYFNIRLLPKILSEKSPIFRYYSCKFKTEKSMRQSARLVMSQNLGIKYTYTMENSLFGFIDAERNSHAFKYEDFKELGKKLVESIYEFSRGLKSKKSRKSGRNKEVDNHFNIIEENKPDNSTSESDSQSESEEDCIEAKKNIILAVKKFKKASSRKEKSQISEQKERPSKRIKSQNHLSSLTKNLPTLSRKQMVTNKVNIGIVPAKNSYQSITNSIVKNISLNESFKNDDNSSPTIEINTSNISLKKIESEKFKYSKINLFEMFTKRKEGIPVEKSEQKFRKNFNFPAFFSKPLRNT